MASSGQELSPSDYIVHHLQNLGTSYQEKIVDFSILNVDTLFWSLLCGLLGVALMAWAARKAVSGVPGRFQAAIEILFEMVDGQAKSIIHGNRAFIAPLALTVFVWIVLMNAMDLIPVDLLPMLASAVGIEYMRVVPTADLNGSLGLSLGVLLLIIFYSLKIKGPLGVLKEFCSAPFGYGPLGLLIPFNFVLNIVELLAKGVSLGMRLFGNMYAGELIFMLIALLGAGWTGFGLVSLLGMFGHVLAGTIWAIFHLLVVVLQAFIFMMLTLIYVGQAHDAH